jgi:lipocalin
MTSASLLSIIFVTGLVIIPNHGCMANMSALTTGCSNYQQVIDQSVELDLERYDGVWFEQVRTRNSAFEGECFCSQANYTIAHDGSVVVDNSCRKGSATASVANAIGKAYIPYPKHPGFLLLSFGIPFVKASYIVLDTDYTEYSIIASCPRFFGDGFVWILTREQSPHPEFIDGLKNKTVEFGFARDRLIDTYQGPKCNDSKVDDFFTHDYSFVDSYF